MTGHSSCNLEVNNCEVVKKKKERHIVSWSQEEDDILREQIGLHGSENWAIIASKFKDKTTRQCRRRWFTYLNSDFKKGGWSPEEDILLCEAQKIYGNRWTEIAKVVSGRTDNAVKNRFTTLCKKRAKREALVKVTSSTSLINLNNKRVIFRDGLNSDEGSENAAPLKKIRDCISSSTDSHKHGETPAVECGAADHLLGHPLAATSRNAPCYEVNRVKKALADKSVENRFLRTFLKKDDPKLLTLMQQAELLSSLAIKVNADMTDQSLENAWMVLEDFLRQSKECKMLKATNRDADFQLEKLKEDLRSCDEGSRSPWRELNAYESSPASSEYSTGSTLVSNVPCDKREERDAEILALSQETGHVFEAVKLDQQCLSEENGVCHVGSTNEVKSMPAYEDVKTDKGAERDCTITEFSSPTRVTPLFTTLAAAIPSPKFSESEKHFLMKTLGLESSSPRPIMSPSQPPPCKRSLLHCL